MVATETRERADVTQGGKTGIKEMWGKGRGLGADPLIIAQHYISLLQPDSIQNLKFTYKYKGVGYT